MTFTQHSNFLKPRLNKVLHGDITRIQQLNPSPELLLKTLLFVIDMGQVEDGDKRRFIPTSVYSEQAITQILRQCIPKLKDSNTCEYDVHLFNACASGLKCQTDLNLLARMKDLEADADFRYQPELNGRPANLAVPPPQRSTNNFVLRTQKEHFKRLILAGRSQVDVSQLKHFQNVDPKFKTTDGLLGILYSDNIKVQQTSDIPNAAILDEHGVLERFWNGDLSVVNDIMMLQFWQALHFFYRQALAEMYIPNYAIEVDTINLQLPNKQTATVFEYLAVNAFLIAYYKAKNLWGTSADFFKGQIPQYRAHYTTANNGLTPFSNNWLNKECENNFVRAFSEFLERIPYLYQELSPDDLWTLAQKLEETKSMPIDRMKAIIEHITTAPLEYPICPLFKAGDTYMFSNLPLEYPYNQALYSFLLSDAVFDSRKGAMLNNGVKKKPHQYREEQFVAALRLLFQTAGFSKNLKISADNNFPIGYEQGGQNDLLIYSQEENLLLVVEVKLCNIHRFREGGVKDWAKNKIGNLETRNSAVFQLKKDLTLIKTDIGKEWLHSLLEPTKSIDHNKLRVVPLIITDNFYADHADIELSDNNRTTVIDVFELEQLLTGKKIHQAQELPEISSLTQLLDAIYKNCFWGFLPEIIDKSKPVVLQELVSTIPKYNIQLVF